LLLRRRSLFVHGFFRGFNSLTFVEVDLAHPLGQGLVILLVIEMLLLLLHWLWVLVGEVH